jgi:hypothetical protein
MEESNQLYAPAALPFSRRLDRSQGQSGRGGHEKKSLPPPPGIEFGRPSHNVVIEGVSKSSRTGRLEGELQMIQLSATRCSCIAIL